jgi:hypothetical protein
MARNARSKHARNRKRNLAAVANPASPKTFPSTKKPAATQAAKTPSASQLYKTPGKNTKTSNYTYKPLPVDGSMALWIMTPFGVLMPALRPKYLLKDGDKRTLQVRTRRAEYLDAFREQYCPDLGENEHHPSQDYQWKAPVTPEALAGAVARMVMDTDTGKFKPLTEGPKGLKDKKLAKDLHAMYTGLWSSQLRYGDGTSSYDHSWFKNQKTGTYSQGYYGSGPTLTGVEACKRWGHLFEKSDEAHTITATCIDCHVPNPNYPERGPDNSYPEGGGPEYAKEQDAIWKAAKAKEKETLDAKLFQEDPDDLDAQDELDEYHAALAAYDYEKGEDLYPGEHGQWQDYAAHELDGVVVPKGADRGQTFGTGGMNTAVVTQTWHREAGKNFGHPRESCREDYCGLEDTGMLTDYYHRLPRTQLGHPRRTCTKAVCGLEPFAKDWHYTDLDKQDGAVAEETREENQPASS